MKEYRFVVSEEQEEERLDRVLASLLPDSSRSFLQRLIKNGSVVLNAQGAKPATLLKSGDVIELSLPEASLPEIPAVDIPLDIVYEDEDLLVVNKPQGMVVHPAPGHYDDTLVNALLYHCKDLSGINGVMRPGIVHRIDRDTSGLLMVCKNDEAHRKLALQLAEHSIQREYRAIALGVIKEDEGHVDAPIGRDSTDRKRMCVHSDLLHAREAYTQYYVEERFGDCTYIRCRLRTGRTHQIRVHMAHIGHPILGDLVYGPKKMPYGSLTRGQVLHAALLGFVHPRTGEEMLFSAPLPDNFAQILKKCRCSL
ncbi:MAG: RluA family pseudouridine synthase [Lachnospiraceae bacterium]|nr:RluA family pseudouridine synthase [Lachnospiraceae bacterium]